MAFDLLWLLFPLENGLVKVNASLQKRGHKSVARRTYGLNPKLYVVAAAGGGIGSGDAHCLLINRIHASYITWFVTECYVVSRTPNLDSVIEQRVISKSNQKSNYVCQTDQVLFLSIDAKTRKSRTQTIFIIIGLSGVRTSNWGKLEYWKRNRQNAILSRFVTLLSCDVLAGCAWILSYLVIPLSVYLCRVSKHVPFLYFAALS